MAPLELGTTGLGTATSQTRQEFALMFLSGIDPGKRGYRPGGFGGWQVIASSKGFNAEPIIHCVSESLLASEVFLSRLHRYMTEEKLDLFQFAS